MSTIAVAKKLGGARVIGREVKTDFDLIEAVRDGLPVRTLDYFFGELASLHLPLGIVYRAIGSERTLQRKRADHTRLSPIESDRLARFARVLVRAESALGDSTRGRRWLARDNRALGGVRPIDLLDSDTGTLAVERVLGRIEHGIYE